MVFKSVRLLVYVRASLENGENSRLSSYILVAQLVVNINAFVAADHNSVPLLCDNV